MIYSEFNKYIEYIIIKLIYNNTTIKLNKSIKEINVVLDKNIKNI